MADSFETGKYLAQLFGYALWPEKKIARRERMSEPHPFLFCSFFLSFFLFSNLVWPKVQGHHVRVDGGLQGFCNMFDARLFVRLTPTLSLSLSLSLFIYIRGDRLGAAAARAAMKTVLSSTLRPMLHLGLCSTFMPRAT